MDSVTSSDLQQLHEELDEAERDARALVADLSEGQGMARLRPESWSVAECLDHIATANCVYLRAMEDPAQRARARGSRRARPAQPGLIGGLFVWTLEPPVRWWIPMKAPQKIRPRPGPALADAYASFIRAQADVHDFINKYGDIELARVRFPNPFLRGVRFSLATGLHVITAHERRHLLQAWNVRRSLFPTTHHPSNPHDAATAAQVPFTR